jgi:hypothetical protein
VFNPTAINMQSDVIGPASTTRAGVMTAAQVQALDGFSAAVDSVSGAAPIVSSGGANPIISIDPATPSSDGSMSAADKAKLDSLAPGSVSSVSGTAPIVSSGGATPDISIDPATTTDPGSMSAADKAKLDAILPAATGVAVGNYQTSGLFLGVPMRPAANAVGATALLSVMITNLDEKAPNFAMSLDGGATFNWYDAVGNLT